MPMGQACMTGRHADGWIPSLGHAPAGQLPVMRGKVLAAARQAGRSPDELTCALNVEIHVGDRAEPRPGLIAGHGDQVAASLLAFVAAGFTAFNFMPVGAPAREQMERLATDVIPVLRATA